MVRSTVDTLFRPIAKHLHRNHMQRLGIGRTMRMAHWYNQAKFRRQDEFRRRMFGEKFEELLNENGGLARPMLQMKDGFVIDASMTLPHLDRILEDSRQIIAQRAGKPRKAGTYRSYFQDMWSPEDVERYPSFIDFASSSDVLSTVGDYVQSIPILSTTLPPGIRFVESNNAYDTQPDTPKDSQLYHIDYYSQPNVYVIVLLEDTTSEHGPWTFLPRGISQEVKQKLGYWEKRKGYRIGDSDIYKHVDKKDAIEFTGARGTVLFIESSGCLHYGSRNSYKPRFQLMIAYSGSCRTDFSEVVMKEEARRINPGDSRLRKLLLNKYLTE